MRAGRLVPLRLLALAALAACSSSSSQPAATAAVTPPATAGAGPAAATALPAPRFLRWVPADTPYFYGVLAPPDQGHVEREYVAKLAAYEKVLPAVQKLEREHPADLRRLSFKTRLAVGLLAEAGGRATRASLAAIGMDPVTVGAIYGAGAAPVVRIQLSDPAKFTEVLGRIASHLGATRATLGSRVYYTGKEDVIVWLLAVVDGDLVLAVLPADRRDQQARAVLADAPPARSLATERSLDVMAGTYGFGAGGIGFADLAGLGGALAGGLGAGCADELRGFAGAVPRVLVGVTAASRQEIRFHSIVEMRADLAGKLRDLRGEVPRSDVSGARAPELEIALALDVGALLRGLAGAFDRVRASPFRCPTLSALNDLARTQGKTLRQIAKALAGVRGASMAVRNISGLTLGQADLFFLFGTDRPGDLLDRLAAAMGTRRPKLQPGDAPVELKVPLSTLGAVHGAVAPRAAGLSVGAEPAELTEMLTADAVDDPPMFFSRIDMRAVAQVRALIAGAALGADPRMAAADPDLARQLGEIEGSDLDRFAEAITTARATQRGLELDFVGRYPP